MFDSLEVKVLFTTW